MAILDRFGCYKTVILVYPAAPSSADDRSHMIERSVNKRTGEEERKQDFVNIDESELYYFGCFIKNFINV